jgi:hypothetical protein
MNLWIVISQWIISHCRMLSEDCTCIQNIQGVTAVDMVHLGVAIAQCTSLKEWDWSNLLHPLLTFSAATFLILYSSISKMIWNSHMSLPPDVLFFSLMLLGGCLWKEIAPAFHTIFYQSSSSLPGVAITWKLAFPSSVAPFSVHCASSARTVVHIID